MQNYELKLIAPISDSFYAKKAKDSVDLNSDEKAQHYLKIENVDLEKKYNVGLIYGASGSGKTTIAKKIFGEITPFEFDAQKAIIDQFPDDWSYDDRTKMLNSIGLSQVPCWLKPIGLLSNGQQERAKISIAFSKKRELYIFDEWTSVVDRNVAKIMSHSIQKYARKNDLKIILISCHEDVFEWLNPDWIINCNDQKFIDRREFVGRYERREKFEFSIREVEKSTWKNFSKYHYLRESLAGGKNITFGLFLGEKQIGFQCFSNYVPHRNKKDKMILHSNRTVIHPDYVGFGLGIRLIDETSFIIKKMGYRVMAKFSSLPVYKAMIKNKNWILKEKTNNLKVTRGGSMQRKSGFREKITTYSFEFIG